MFFFSVIGAIQMRYDDDVIQEYSLLSITLYPLNLL